jgi:Tol biopolymer transport system component
VEDVPAAQVPATAPDTGSGTRSSDGRVLAVENDGGRVRLTMQDAAGLHVLLEAEGGSQYSLGSPRWSPDEAFVLTTDSAARLLVTTLGTSPQTRVLATRLGGGFAVTASQE